MNSTEPTQLDSAPATATALLVSGNPASRLPDALSGIATASAASVPKASGYGLPCAKCRTYYAAALPACPICKSPERVSPTTSSRHRSR